MGRQLEKKYLMFWNSLVLLIFMHKWTIYFRPFLVYTSEFPYIPLYVNGCNINSLSHRNPSFHSTLKREVYSQTYTSLIAPLLSFVFPPLVLDFMKRTPHSDISKQCLHHLSSPSSYSCPLPLTPCLPQLLGRCVLTSQVIILNAILTESLRGLRYSLFVNMNPMPHV